MERKVAYAKIKELGLQEEVKKQFGDNYTRVPTDKLEAVINQHSSGAAPDPAPAKPKEKADEKKPVAKKETKKPAKTEDSEAGKTEDNSVSTDNIYEAACLTFLGILKDSGMLEDLLKKL